jgi:hypothetical protein
MAVARPMPEPAPVTKATLSLNRPLAFGVSVTTAGPRTRRRSRGRPRSVALR